MVTPNDVLSFWFGEYEPLESLGYAKVSQWFKKDPEFDSLIKTRFEDALQRAFAGEFDHWIEESPLHGVALVIILDQFSRNMYRGTGQMFAFDSKGLAVANALIAKGWDKQLPPPARAFVYTALEHAEDMNEQRKLMRLMDEMVAESPEHLKQGAQQFQNYAKQHYDVVERFGRYPHRNALLGRESTPEELEYMQTHPGF